MIYAQTNKEKRDRNTPAFSSITSQQRRKNEVAKMTVAQMNYLEGRVHRVVQEQRAIVTDMLRPIRVQVTEEVIADLGLQKMVDQIAEAMKEAVVLDQRFAAITGRRLLESRNYQEYIPDYASMPKIKGLIEREVERRLEGTDLHDVETKILAIREEFMDKVFLTNAPPEMKTLVADIKAAMQPIETKLARIESKDDKKQVKRVARKAGK